MANRYLIASGDSEDPAIYDGGTLPAVDDVLRLNAFVWTVTANRTLAELRTDASAPAVATTAARCVLLANGVTLTCTTQVQGNDSTGIIGCSTGAATATVISPSFVKSLVSANATETVNVIGNGDSTGLGASGAMMRGAGTVNWTGNITNPIRYIFDAISGGAFNLTGNIFQTGGDGFWARGNTAFRVTGDISNAAVPLYDTTTTTYPPFVHNGSLIAGTVPVIRSRSPYYGSGPFINNGEVMALSCDKVRLIGPDVQWNMVDTSLAALSLYTASGLTGYPLQSKVENLTIYGPSNEFTGTLEPVNVNTQQLASDLLTELFNNGTPWATPQFVTAALTAITPSP
jgi:hypothetical protein